MCGIVGLGSTRVVEQRSWLHQGIDVLTHRGPDDMGEWWSQDGIVGFGHRRLSIFDLSPSGHQPMLNDDYGLCVVFNGEIYNFCEIRKTLECHGYKFITSCDTEVLLAAYDYWGRDCVAKLNGMFAFAIYDQKRKILFLARDRAGEKPLFYYVLNGVLYFASELKALLANPDLPKKIDAVSMDCYFSMGYVPGDRCILAGYNKLPPAHSMTFDLKSGSIDVRRYWEVPAFCGYKNRDISDKDVLVDELENLLEHSVEKMLVADVPVGVL